MKILLLGRNDQVGWALKAGAAQVLSHWQVQAGRMLQEITGNNRT